MKGHNSALNRDLHFIGILVGCAFKDFKDINKIFVIIENITTNEIQMANKMTGYGIWN